VTPLWQAAEKGDTHALKLLVAKGAKVGATGSGMPSALYQAVVRSDKPVVRVLLDSRANMDKNSAGCDSPLFEAISKGNKEISGLFLTKLRMGIIACGMRS
jgi:ankyrin repeat protein